MTKPRYETCWRCGKAWMVSKTLPRLRNGEAYFCPKCTRPGEHAIMRRK